MFWSRLLFSILTCSNGHAVIAVRLWEEADHCQLRKSVVDFAMDSPEETYSLPDYAEGLARWTKDTCLSRPASQRKQRSFGSARMFVDDVADEASGETDSSCTSLDSWEQR